ncbi:MAG: hypothetical protein ACREQR_12250 [Candidatus Binataceae bacterium]
MKWCFDLVVRGNSDALGKLIATIESRLEPNWYRDLEAESRAVDLTNVQFYAIRCRGIYGDIGFVLARDKDAISVENIGTFRGRSLSPDQYNALLDYFFTKFLKPAADELGLKCHSHGFEIRYPESTESLHRPSAIEIAIGFGAVLRLREEGYLSPFRIRDEFAGTPVDRSSTQRRRLDISPWRQN